jgi:alpha-L-fucosidase
LLTNYGPIGLVWFDRGMFTMEQGMEFVNLVNELQPATLINGRVGHYYREFIGDYQSTNDNGMPPGGLEEYWETPQTLNETWGYSKFDERWKSPEEVIRRLVEVVSRGGNYLLNIGPKGNGEIPDTTVAIFKKVGQWMERNSESIYGTTANPFGELSWGYCTVKDNKLYLVIRDWPEDNKLVLQGLKNSVLKAYPLTDKSKILNVLQDENETCINLSSVTPDDPLSVIVIEIEGEPDVIPQHAIQDESGSMKLDYLTVCTKGKAQTRYNRKGGFHISKWTGPEDAIDWFIDIDKPGKFKVCIDYSAKKEWEGKRFEVSFGKYKLSGSVIHTGEIFDYKEFPLGYVDIKETGEYILTIRPLVYSDDYLMYLRSITLDPVEKMKDKGWGAD